MEGNATCSLRTLTWSPLDVSLYRYSACNITVQYSCALLEIFGGILLVLVLGILYEGLKTLREVLAAREVKQQQGGSTSVNLKSAEGAPLIPAQSEGGYV